jgi:hypothetical protein
VIAYDLQSDFALKIREPVAEGDDHFDAFADGQAGHE